MRTRTRTRRAVVAATAVGVAALTVVPATLPAMASSHREAPAITEDPCADITDVYGFVSPDRPDSTTLIMNVIPFELPGGGPNFHKPCDDVLYELKVDSNGNAVEDVTYQFRFTTTVTNPATFLYNTGQVTSLTDPDLNIRQTYSVTEVRGGRRAVIGRDIPVAPANVGTRSMPSYDGLANAAITEILGGVKTFVGPRDDPFFADLGAIFDLGGLRPLNEAHLVKLPKEAGRDYLAGFNVHTIAIQVPNNMLTDGDPVIGVWATTSRRGENSKGIGENWKQVARLGMPLVNEVVVPVGAKDLFNSSEPIRDGQFAAGVLNPELGRLIPVLYPGVKVPTNVDAGLKLGGREDIATIFLTGIPGVNQPRNVRPAEMLRINTGTRSGFPNGRLLTDDVVDTSLQVVAGATDFSKEFKVAPNNALGDGVNANDKPMLSAFPTSRPRARATRPTSVRRRSSPVTDRTSTMPGTAPTPVAGTTAPPTRRPTEPRVRRRGVVLVPIAVISALLVVIISAQMTRRDAAPTAEELGRGTAALRAAEEALDRAVTFADPTAAALAEQQLATAERLLGATAPVLRARAGLAVTRHEFATGEELVQAALRVAPADPAAMVLAVDTAVELGRYDEARDRLDAAMAIEPTAGTYARLSYLRQLDGDGTGAELAMRQAVSASADGSTQRAVLLGLLGDVQLENGRIRQAERSYREAATMEPGLAAPAIGLARIAAATGDLRSAADRLDGLTLTAPSPSVLALRADLARVSGDARAVRDAEELLDAAVALHRAGGSVIDAELAVELAQRDDPTARAEAVRLARAAYSDRRTVFTADALAWALHRSGATAAAQPYVREAIGKDSALGAIQARAAIVLAAGGDLVAARQASERARLAAALPPTLAEALRASTSPHQGAPR